MAYRYGERNQMTLLPSSIEEYVPEDAPVRVYDAFVEALDFENLGIAFDENKVGNSAYDPRAMLKLLVYGYSYGIRSSRKLERETHYNMSFIWLVGGLKPDHKTIAEFRRNNKPAIKDVLKQCARLCVRLDLIAGNTLFVDGTKMRANASSRRNWTEKRCRKALARLDERIDGILSECEKADDAESGEPSFVRMDKELKDAESMKAKVREIARELEDSGRKTMNTTDPESRVVKGNGAFMTGYNAQAGVDGKHGLIVSADVVDSEADSNQLSGRVDDSNETAETEYDTVVADAGYYSVEDLKKVDSTGADVVVPNIDQAAGREASGHGRDEFTYDEEQDCYFCPEGHRLKYYTSDDKMRIRRYRITDAGICRSCRRYGECTRSKNGRSFARSYDIEHIEKFKRQYDEKTEVYRLRKEYAERPFGHIKENLGARGFLLRGLAGAGAEFSLLATAYNLVRMIKILGVKRLIGMLKGKSALRTA